MKKGSTLLAVSVELLRGDALINGTITDLDGKYVFSEIEEGKL